MYVRISDEFVIALVDLLFLAAIFIVGMYECWKDENEWIDPNNDGVGVFDVVECVVSIFVKLRPGCVPIIRKRHWIFEQ